MTGVVIVIVVMMMVIVRVIMIMTVAAIATLTVTATAFAARLAATRSGYGALALRGIEVAAAAVVLIFGVALLAGYMASERLIGA